jgi:hypothetical protein
MGTKIRETKLQKLGTKVLKQKLQKSGTQISKFQEQKLKKFRNKRSKMWEQIFLKNPITKSLGTRITKIQNNSYINPGTKMTRIHEQKLRKYRNKNYKNLGTKSTKI